MNFWFADNEGKVTDWDTNKEIGTCQVVGEIDRTNPMTGQTHKAQLVYVTQINGETIRCSRLSPTHVLVPL